jgi:hypothetical protein
VLPVGRFSFARWLVCLLVLDSSPLVMRRDLTASLHIERCTTEERHSVSRCPSGLNSIERCKQHLYFIFF